MTPDPITAAYLAEAARHGAPDQLIDVARQHLRLDLTSFNHDCLSRPVFLDHASLAELAGDLDVLHAALAAIPDRLFAGDLAAFGRAAGMTEVQVSAIMRGSGTPLTKMARILPWTRMIRPEPVTVGGERADLVEYATAERENLLIKPTALYGGIGVVHGWLTEPDEWSRQLKAAMDGPFVLQRRIRPLAEPFPADGGPRPYVLSWGACYGTGGYSGMIVRGSMDPDVAVMNMAQPGVSGTCCFHQMPPGAPAPGPERR